MCKEKHQKSDGLWEEKRSNHCYERQIAQLQDRLIEAQMDAEHYCDQLAQAKEDTEMLDWLSGVEADVVAFEHNGDTVWQIAWSDEMIQHKGTLRQAIREAMG
jgi:hypothetical protein